MLPLSKILCYADFIHFSDTLPWPFVNNAPCTKLNYSGNISNIHRYDPIKLHQLKTSAIWFLMHLIICIHEIISYLKKSICHTNGHTMRYENISAGLIRSSFRQISSKFHTNWSSLLWQVNSRHGHVTLVAIVGTSLLVPYYLDGNSHSVSDSIFKLRCPPGFGRKRWQWTSRFKWVAMIWIKW